MSVEQKDLLRFLTAGSVDDGKSTLIGRLLYDSHQIYDDHLNGLKKDSLKKGWENGELDYSLLLDGLKAEREQNITIDVAYRYFSTSKRKFIVADTPGHEQYTPNMATGASNADLLVLLINALHGIVPQTCRHSFIASLMGIKHIVVAINKMDAVHYSENVFEQIQEEYTEFSKQLGLTDIYFIPISAFKGDNVVKLSQHMPWYTGKPLLSYLEEAVITDGRNFNDFRFPVQLVLRPNSEFRGYAGTLASGLLKKGEEVMALPSRQKSRVRSILKYQEEVEEAFTSQSVTILLDNEIDISRGDMLVHTINQPKVRTKLEAVLIWMNSEKKALPGNRYLLKHCTKWVSTLLNEIAYKIDVNTLQRQKEAENSSTYLAFNEIGHVTLTLAEPIFADNYQLNRSTGCFILIDPLSHQTVAAGMIGEAHLPVREYNFLPLDGSSDSMTSHNNNSLNPHESSLNQKGLVIWLTGLSGSGKTTLAQRLEGKLLESGHFACILDGDDMRKSLNRDLGFSKEDRSENVRRIGEIAALLASKGIIVIAALISPYQHDREVARKMVPEGRFIEVFINAPYEVCRSRDPKGLYKKAIAGNIADFTGVSAPYEPPFNPELIIDTQNLGVEEALDQIMHYFNKLF